MHSTRKRSFKKKTIRKAELREKAESSLLHLFILKKNHWGGGKKAGG